MDGRKVSPLYLAASLHPDSESSRECRCCGSREATEARSQPMESGRVEGVVFLMS